MTDRARHVPRWLAAALAASSALALGMTLVSGPASASHPGHQAPVRGVTVTRFVIRDASGAVISRGATATLPGAPTWTMPASTGRTVVKTARRGHGVTVRHVGPGSFQQAVTAHR